jgi:Ca2+-binding RTX toxin-like protein
VREGAPYEIFSMNATGGGYSRLTNNALIDLNPVASPDGTRVLLQRYVDIMFKYELFTMGAGGGAEVRVTTVAGFDESPDWQRVVVVNEPESSAADPTAPCTITGTAGADVLVGTDGNDVICGLGGKDVLLGNGGNDVLRGGKGKDTLLGAAGDDFLFGGKGADKVNGGLDLDLCVGESKVACEA